MFPLGVPECVGGGERCAGAWRGERQPTESGTSHAVDAALSLSLSHLQVGGPGGDNMQWVDAPRPRPSPKPGQEVRPTLYLRSGRVVRSLLRELREVLHIYLFRI